MDLSNFVIAKNATASLLSRGTLGRPSYEADRAS